MENSQVITQFINALNVSLDDLEPLIKSLNDESFQDKIDTTSSPLDRIKIANGYTYILTSLCFTYLKSQGVDTNKHPIMEDLNRIKSYMKRATEASNPKPNKPEIDSAAAKRFIQSALSNSSGVGNSTVIKGTPEPAISSASFKGTHTKFTSTESDDEEKEVKEQVSKSIGDKLRNKLKLKSSKSKTKSRNERVDKK